MPPDTNITREATLQQRHQLESLRHKEHKRQAVYQLNSETLTNSSVAFPATALEGPDMSNVSNIADVTSESRKNAPESPEMNTETYVDMEFLQAHDKHREYLADSLGDARDPWSLTGYSSFEQNFGDTLKSAHDQTVVEKSTNKALHGRDDAESHPPYCLCPAGYHGRLCETRDDTRKQSTDKFKGMNYFHH